MLIVVRNQALEFQIIAPLLPKYRPWTSQQIFLSLSFPISKAEIIMFSSVAQSCLTLCDPMDCSHGFPVHHQLPELPQKTHVYRVSDAIQLSHSVVPLSSCLQSFPASGSFQMSHFFASGGHSTGASALASVLPMNIQRWFPLGLTGLISLQSRGFSWVFSNITVQKHQFFGAQPSLWSNSHIHAWLLGKNIAWLYRTCQQSDIFAFQYIV